MYPYLFNLNFLPSYIVFICLGIFAALVLFRTLAFKAGISEKSFRFFGVIIIASIGLGFVFAWLFQMLYNYAQTGKAGTGITFLGGLVGGVATFFIIFLIFGSNYKSDIFKVVNLTIPCIALGHCIGRIGCFLAGCCYGKITSGFWGVKFVEKISASGEWIFGLPRVPTQLFEAIFLLLLCAALIILIFKFKRLDLCAIVYMYSYAIFRFLLEFLRDDPRGAFLLSLSPSQVICIVMLVGAAALNVYVVKANKKRLNSGNQNSTL